MRIAKLGTLKTKKKMVGEGAGFNPTINAKISANYVVFTFIEKAKGKYILASLKDKKICCNIFFKVL
jgi:hypothetical protein